MKIQFFVRPIVMSLAVLCLVASAHSETIRYMGIDINTMARNPSDTSTTITNTRFFSPSVATLAGLSGLPALTGSEISAGAFAPAPFSATSGTSTATTSYSINNVSKTFTLSIPNHSVSGTPTPPTGDDIFSSNPGANIAGSEGVVHFYALTPGTLTVTYDYDAPTEEAGAPTDPYKPGDRGRSKQYVYKNSKGSGSGETLEEFFDERTGSVSFNTSIGPGDDLIALQFDLRLWDSPANTVTNGFLTMSFTPVPEPGSLALLGLGGVGLLAVWRRAKRRAGAK